MTFLENHDTGYRTNEDGSPEKGHQFDSFANTWEVEQAYAQILTLPLFPRMTDDDVSDVIAAVQQVTTTHH